MLAQLLALVATLPEPIAAKSIEPGTWDGWFTAVCVLAGLLASVVLWLVAFGRKKGAKEQRSEDLAAILKVQTDAAAATLKAQTDSAAQSLKAQTDASAATLRVEIATLKEQLNTVATSGNERAGTIRILERDALRTHDCKVCRGDIDAAMARTANKVEALSETSARGEERVKTLFENLARVEGKVDMILARVSGTFIPDPLPRQKTDPHGGR